jgi:putative tryptophan/tyrosine transport system substrate-binding protein
MRRRYLIGGLAAGAALWPLAVRGQQAAVPRIGILDPGIAHLFAAFFKGMQGLGYEEGRNVSYVRRSAEGHAERIPALAAELVDLKVSLIVTAAPQPVRAAMAATATIPIVFAAVGDAVGNGIVQSLARPGRNATGLSFLNTEISSKRLQLLHEAVPSAQRVAVLSDRSNPPNSLDATKQAGRSLRLELQILDVADPGEFEGAFQAAVSGGAKAIDVLASAFFNANRVRLAELAAKYRLPAMYETSEYVHSGGLMSYGPSLTDLFRRAATYVDKILKGSKPSDLPVEQPTKFELVINLKTAKALGLTIPPLLLASADEVIQ